MSWRVRDGEATALALAPFEPSGPPVVEATYHVNPEAIVRYAGASGDFTSFHYDVDRARSMGYDTLFAMGMLAAGHLGTVTRLSAARGTTATWGSICARSTTPESPS